MHYEILINKEKKEYVKKYDITYNRINRNICIDENCGMIFFDLKTNQQMDKFISGRIFEGLLKRLFIAYFIYFEKRLDVDNCTVKIGDCIKENIPVNFNVQYSSVYVKLPDCLKNDDAIKYILKNLTSTHYEMVSFNNFILACCSNQDYYRFMNLWMAFNGLYGGLGNRFMEKVNETLAKKINYYTESMLLRIWGICFDNRSNFFIEGKGKKVPNVELTKKIKNEICKLTDINSIDDFSSSELNNIIINMVQNVYPGTEMKDSFYFLLLVVTYNIRCGVFHGNSKINLISSNKTSRCISFLNNLLLEYLGEKIPLFFNCEKVEEIFNKNIDFIKTI